MAQLSSPGVSVSVIDESFYTPAAPGTVPLIIVASAQDKSNGAGTGTAAGTLQANAGQVYLLTSQKDLSDTFGTPVFKTDANNNPVHAGEQNEYGLQAAYSYLGVSNRAYVVRADIDLNELDASPDAPAGDPEDGTYWLDTANTAFGIFEWNSASETTTGGQTFTVKYPTVITDTNKVTDFQNEDYSPKSSLGAIGDYAVVAVTSLVKVWYKKGQTNTAPGWVEVGSSAWVASRPTAVGVGGTGTFNSTDDLTINSTLVANASSLSDLVTKINDAAISGVTAAAINGKLELYSTGVAIEVSGSGTILDVVGLDATTYLAPALQISPHYTVPTYKRTDAPTSAYGRPTGSVWVKTTSPNAGARWRIKRYNAATKAFVELSSGIYESNIAALAALDANNGGSALAVGTTYIRFNDDGSSPTLANFKAYVRTATGETVATTNVLGVTSGTTIAITESVPGTTTTNEVTDISVSSGASGLLSAEALADAINGAGLTYVVATANSDNSVSIVHTAGGDFEINSSANISGLFASANAYVNPLDNTIVTVSSWRELAVYDAAYTQEPVAPTTVTADGRLWYNSIVDEVDIMVHDGDTWVGYLNYTQNQGGGSTTDPAGPIVSATKPTTQSDGSALANGDLWIDTSDIENYPTIYKYNFALKKWLLVDKSDQSTENGILFADARAGTTGGTATEAPSGTIAELLENDFLDFDAPDPALYPKGMLLWNLRRSGFNVKKFSQNYVDVLTDNERWAPAGTNEAMTNYYPHRWISWAANQEDGSGTFGRKAQRKVVVQALQALVNANQQIRDEESRVFNLIACPGYSELVGEMVSLNYDRGLTAFVVADTPARLTPDATSLSNWGNNVNGALEDNDKGLVSSDEYLGFFYPWGYTSDNIGNNIAVPPSHMILRTIALSDQVAYPWFAPAGTRRGGITNATAVGYITSEGEFQSVALNNGQRDTLASIKVNPITFITGTGLVNYGQYTRAKNASALDRINVARLVIYLRRQFAQLAKPYVFEPNDKITRDEIKGAAESLLLELVGQRALYDYLVVCDESNNTPSRIDRNELYLDVAIEPVKAVEFIYIPLRLKNTGEIAGLA